MKRIGFIFVGILTYVLVNAQQHPVDKLFDKYYGKEGYTSVIISSKMFRMLSDVEIDDKEIEQLIDNLTGIKILAVDHSVAQDKNVNFYKEIMTELPVNEYEVLMEVKEKDKDVTFLVKEYNGKINELLLIVGGTNDNALISIRGLIDLNNIAKLARAMQIEGLENLEKIKENNTDKK